MADHVQKIFELEDEQNHIPVLKTLEIKCADVSAEIERQLKSYVTPPFDSEDILSLTNSLNDISVMLVQAAIGFNITQKKQLCSKVVFNNQRVYKGNKSYDLSAKSNEAE